MPVRPQNPTIATTRRRHAACAFAAAAALALVGFKLSASAVNLVTYEVKPLGDASVLGERAVAPPLAAPLPVALGVVGLIGLGIVVARKSAGRDAAAHVCDPAADHRSDLAWVPTLGLAGIGVLWLFATEPTFATICAATLLAGGSMLLLAGGLHPPHASKTLEVSAFVVLLLAVVANTIWSAASQYRSWQHFQLGYADFGLFTRELEYCLPWSDVADRFRDTRMAYHFEPLFYLLTPLYAVFRSPAFLMVIGPLAIGSAALAFYQLARSRTGSPLIGLIVGLSWLLLPSISRMPHAGSYGFESVHLAVPLLAFSFCAALRDRWRTSHVCLSAAVLCQETVCGVALGWSLYLLLFTRQRRAALVILVTTLAYLLIVTQAIIPSVAASGDYVRTGMFGELSPRSAWERLTSAESRNYLLALATPLCFGLLRSWRLLLAAIPTVAAILLLENRDYLSIRYWHQSSLLPLLFTAAVCGVTTRSASSANRSGTRVTLGGPLALLVGAALFHQMLGFTPFTQADRVDRSVEENHRPDPRLAAAEWVRAAFAPSQTSIVATERMAAHFIDYRALDTAGAFAEGDDLPDVEIVILDPSDRWDALVSDAPRFSAFVQRLLSAGFMMRKPIEGVEIYARE